LSVLEQKLALYTQKALTATVITQKNLPRFLDEWDSSMEQLQVALQNISSVTLKASDQLNRFQSPDAIMWQDHLQRLMKQFIAVRDEISTTRSKGAKLKVRFF